MAASTPHEKEALKSFLLRAVSVQTDAEPQLLADYLLALLGNKTDIGLEELTTEVSEFVETDAAQLAKTLYQAIQTKSYLIPTGPASSRPGPSTPRIPTGPSNPGPGSDKKRTLSMSDDVEMRDASGSGRKMMKLDDRSIRGGRGRGRGVVNGGMGQVSRGKPCFDYHNKGFCARGMHCPYEHGPDSMYPFAQQGQSGMPPNGMPQGGMPFPFMMPFGMNGPQGMAPQPNQPVAGVSTQGMQVDDGAKPDAVEGEYSPDQPGLVGSNNLANPYGFPGGVPPPGMLPFMMNMPGMFPPPFNMNGGRGGRGGSRGRGGRGRTNGNNADHNPDFNNWDGDLSARPPRESLTNTLVVAEIPAEHLNLISIHNQFKQFGTVTNVAVETAAKKALVAFSSHNEARAAWSSKELFFGDRHVKILWHRPREGQGEAGQKRLENSAPLLENLRKMDAGGVDAIQNGSDQANTLPKVDPEIKAQLEEVKERGLRLEKIVAEQKVLMVRLQGAKTPEDKQSLKARLKELIAQSAEIKTANADIDVEKLQAIVEAQQNARDAAAKARADARRVESRPQEGVHSIQEMLDAEMDEHKIQVELEGTNADEADEETLKLRAQLAALKNQASSMGINPDASFSSPRPSRGGRGGYRGRGGAYQGSAFATPSRSLKLDNRPKTLAVTGPAVEQDQRHTLEYVKAWFVEQAGEMVREPVVIDGKIVIVFSSRAVAESALAKGTSIPSISPAVQVGWYNAPTPEVPNGPPAPGMEGIEIPVKHESFEGVRGERDDVD